MRISVTKYRIGVDGEVAFSYHRSFGGAPLALMWRNDCTTDLVLTPPQLRRIAKTLVKWADDMDAAKRKGGK